MALNFSNLPTERPNNNGNLTDGAYKATVFKSEMRDSKSTPGSQYLNVSFKTEQGFVNENYFDSDKPFLQCKLGQLLKACKVTLSGEGSLKDVSKVIQGKEVMVDVIINDNGYPAIDYTGSKEGVYPVTSAKAETKKEETTTTETVLDEELNEVLDTNFTDEDF